MLMRGEDLMGDDRFWDVKAREQSEVENLQREIMDLQAKIALHDRTETIRHAPGFTDFVAKIKDMHSLAREKLVGDDRLTDQGLREQRGRVKGLASVLSVLVNPQVNQELAKKLQDKKNELAEALRRRPKPKPKTEEPKTEVTT